jgi:S1-C subfamily serine protease
MATALGLPAHAGGEPCAEPLSAIFERVSPAVVSINAIKINKGKPQNRFTTVTGSGFFVDKGGQILTNAHVVDGASGISVTLDSGDRVEARILGLDSVLDLALLQISSDARLPVMTLGDSGKVKVGDEVVAIGNPLGLDQTMTSGIVSGINRILPDVPGTTDEPMIQTDAAINPGNSGGPLLDRCGRVIGITTLITQDAQNIGFAIPINVAKSVVRQLSETGRVSRPWIGVQGQMVSPGLLGLLRLPLVPGFLVEVVEDGSPAEKAGLKGGHLSVAVQGEEFLVGGDIVTAVNGQAIKGPDDLREQLRLAKPGQSLRLTVFRDGAGREVTVTVVDRPRQPYDLPAD